MTYGQVTRRMYKCNKTGIQGDQDANASKQQNPCVQMSSTIRKRKAAHMDDNEALAVPAAMKRKVKVIDKTNCQAGMTITKKNGVWTITRLILEHNHQLMAPALAKLLRSHRYFSSQEKAIIRALIEINIPNRKILAFLSFLRGGMKNTNLVKTDISNYRTRVMRECGENDITQVVTFLKQQQAEDPLFFFTFDAGEDTKVRNIFWAYGRSSVSYEQYGDVISFDTTYQTYRYNLKFAPFVGIDGHGDNLLFAGAVLSDETIETFRWLFRTFRTCIGGKAPTSIITDKDPAMKAAIALVFPEAIHRNCLFHIVTKAEMLMGAALTKNPDFA